MEDKVNLDHLNFKEQSVLYTNLKETELSLLTFNGIEQNISPSSPPSSTGHLLNGFSLSMNTQTAVPSPSGNEDSLNGGHQNEQKKGLFSEELETIHESLHRFCPWCGTEYKFGDVFCSVCGNRRSSRSFVSWIFLHIKKQKLNADKFTE